MAEVIVNGQSHTYIIRPIFREPWAHSFWSLPAYLVYRLRSPPLHLLQLPCSQASLPMTLTSDYLRPWQHAVFMYCSELTVRCILSLACFLCNSSHSLLSLNVDADDTIEECIRTTHWCLCFSKHSTPLRNAHRYSVD